MFKFLKPMQSTIVQITERVYSEEKEKENKERSITWNPPQPPL
jgi:hypothetical protein